MYQSYATQGGKWNQQDQCLSANKSLWLKNKGHSLELLQYFSLKEKFPSAFWVIAEKGLGNLNAIFKRTCLEIIKIVTSLRMKEKVNDIFKDIQEYMATLLTLIVISIYS